METLKKYLPILISIMVFCITIIIFLFNEKFDKHLPFDSGKFGTIVAILGVILNSLTIFLLYKQIQEMAEARKSSYQPMLFPKQTFFITADQTNYDLGNEKIKYPYFIKKLDFNDDNDELDIESSPPTIQIFNVGLGAAIEVRYEWHFDTQKVKDLITNTYTLDADDNKDELIFGFINPQSSIEIELPFLYMEMYGKLMNNLQYHSKPSLFLDIIYQDINGYKYRHSFVSRIIGFGKLVEVNFEKTILK